MCAILTTPQAAGQRYIGSGPFVSMSDVARVLKDRLGDKAKNITGTVLTVDAGSTA